MAQVLFKKGPSQYFDTDEDLNSIIFKKSTNPQAPGFSEIYLGDNRCGVGHNFSIGSDGLVPAPTMADIGKVLTPNGWIDVSKISGSDNVKQVGIESSTTLYPILLKGTTGASDYTGQVNFTSTVNQNIPLLSASPNGHLNCKSLGVVEGDAIFLLGDINLMDTPLMSGGHSLNLVSLVNSSTESSPSILLARSESLGTTTDRYTNWRIQNAANGVLTFTPEKTGTSETPFVSVLSNVTAISFTVSGVSSSDTYIKADGSGYGGVFTGAGEAAGTAGLVPAPAIGDAGKYLKGDGTWGEIQGGTQSDWEEDDSTDLSYVQNRPAVRAGGGTNSIISGDLTNNVASGQNSISTGIISVASGQTAVSIGAATIAKGAGSVAEGFQTSAMRTGSHSQNYKTVAFGNYSHSEGSGSITDSTFTISGSANTRTYTTNTTHNLNVGDVISYGTHPNTVITKVDSISSNSFITLETLSTTELTNATIKIYSNIAVGDASHSENSDTKALGDGSHAEGFKSIAEGPYSHSEGSNTKAIGIGSHAEGSYTITENQYEHAQGQFNKSNKANITFGNAGNTIDSIGIGTSESARKNAFEVMQNGDVYVYGVGSYNGTNPTTADTLQEVISNSSADLAIPVTYSELVTLKTGGNLVSGMQYRITDYTCTTTQANTQSASHVFDIIVTADSETELNENARAAHHTGDTYFTNCNLDAWELKYCLENDTNRFVWADTTNGKGVIYYMKDEWNNECPYDFKNILFANSGVSPSPDPGPEPDPGPKGATRDGEVGYCYTFTWVTEDGVIQDATIVCQTMDNGEGMYMGVTGNVIKECYMPVAYEGGGGDDPGTEEMSSINTRGAKGVSMMKGSKSLAKNRDGESGSLKLYLPFNLFINKYEDVDGNYCFGCCSNVLGEDCMFNTFGTWCSMMSFGNNNRSLSFGNENSGLSFGNGNFGLSFGNENSGLSFGNFNSNLSFGNYNCDMSFGNYNESMTFGNGCGMMSFGNRCGMMTFGNDNYNITFGNDNYDMTFGNGNNSMSFGNGNNSMSFGNNIRYVTVFDGAGNCDVTGTDSGYVQYAQILNSVGSNGHVTINFAKDKLYTQVAGLVNGTTLRIWIAEDTVTGPSSVVNNRIAVFDGTTGKIIKDSGVTVADLQVDVPEYTIEKLNQAETGYASSYVLKKDDVQVGSTINIPKDMVVSSGEVKTVTTVNVPYQGAQIGDKYIDLTIANSSSQHIYIPVKDLVDVYKAGNGISIDASNYISVKIDSANANGLATTTSGLKLDLATQSTAGAMSAADKTKLDSINGNYWGSQTLSASASYITTPEFKQVTINGSTTDAQSTDHCVMVYDTTNKCLKFTF